MTNEVRERANKEMARAEKALRAAAILLEKELFEDAVSRAYYAVLHAAKAALAAINVSADTHTSVRRMFSHHLVKEGNIEVEFAKILTAEQEDRELSDYEIDIEIDKSRADQRTQDARKFVERVEQYLESIQKTQQPDK